MTTYVLVHGAGTEDGAGNESLPIWMILVILSTRQRLPASANGATWHRQKQLSTHIQDILNVLMYEDLTDVVLVGTAIVGW